MSNVITMKPKPPADWPFQNGMTLERLCHEETVLSVESVCTKSSTHLLAFIILERNSIPELAVFERSQGLAGSGLWFCEHIYKLDDEPVVIDKNYIKGWATDHVSDITGQDSELEI